MRQPEIITPRLELHHISVAGLISLFDEKSDQLAIDGRDFSNSYQVLIADAGPLPWRVPEVKQDSSANKWFVRFIVLKDSREIIGSTSFHGAPDQEGMMEIGIGLDQKFWGKGYATEALLGMWRWVAAQDGVKTLRYTVSPTNLSSVAIIKKFGFTYVGQQIDDIDGPEDIYEMSVAEFNEKWGESNER